MTLVLGPMYHLYEPEEDFAAFANWHLHFAEKRENLGLSCHLLYICRKK